MVNYCIVPGCRTNKPHEDVLPVFRIPSEKKEKWDKVIGRDTGEHHRICLKHFIKKHVVTHSEHFDTSGKLVAKIPLTRVKLTEDAFPYLFMPEIEEEFQNDDYTLKMSNENEKLSKEVHFFNLMHNYACTKNNQNDSLTTENSKSVDSSNTNNASSLCQPNNSNIVRVKKENLVDDSLGFKKVNNTFKEVCLRIKTLKFPKNWACQTFIEEGYITVYELQIQKSTDRPSVYPTITKSLTIDKDLSVTYRLFDKIVSAELISFKSNILHVKNIERFIHKFWNLIDCCGIGDLSNVHILTNKTAFTDESGVLRHNKCRLVSTKGRCRTCKLTSEVIKRKLKSIDRKNKIKIKSKINIKQC